MKVREVIRALLDDGWYLVATRGSHRQFKHPQRSGKVTVAGHPADDLGPKTLRSILRHAGDSGRATMKFAIVIEKTKRNWSAYAPDLPGCVATGRTARQARERLRGAIRLHIEGMQEDGLSPPAPTTVTDYVEV